MPHVYRVLNKLGEVSEGYRATEPDLPPEPDGVPEWLEREGVRFNDDGRADQDQRWTVEDWGPAMATADPSNASEAES